MGTVLSLFFNRSATASGRPEFEAELRGQPSTRQSSSKRLDAREHYSGASKTTNTRVHARFPSWSFGNRVAFSIRVSIIN
jgi:hypothetical protein